jgi:hypothetical protein
MHSSEVLRSSGSGTLIVDAILLLVMTIQRTNDNPDVVGGARETTSSKRLVMKAIVVCQELSAKWTVACRV